MTIFKETVPITDASVERTAKDAVRISWKTRRQNLGVSIYHGDSPETIHRDHPILIVNGQTVAEIRELDQGSPCYFEILPENGAGIIIGERRLPLQGSVNFRDLGGYQTSDGRRIKWGKLFRSDHLSRLTHDDLVFLQRLKIQCVCDFRTLTEIRKRPDRFPLSTTGKHFHLPIDHLKFDPTDLFEKLKRGDTGWLTREFLIKGYISNIDRYSTVWSEVFKRLAEPDNLPLVFHCTGGKDRTGTCAALILLTLGVSEKTVIYDHGLSNIFLKDVVNKIYAQFEAQGINRRRIAPYFSAPRYCIEAQLAHIRKKYGSAMDYLKLKAGLTDEILAQIREEL
ncbi:MAG: tyrosine-protein phosphatase, partial [Desulfobacterales bacterium]